LLHTYRRWFGATEKRRWPPRSQESGTENWTEWTFRRDCEMSTSERELAMAHGTAKSFRLLRPACPQCSSVRPRFDWSAGSNVWRSLVAVITAAIVYPASRLWFRCPDCGRHFLASRDTGEAARLDVKVSRKSRFKTCLRGIATVEFLVAALIASAVVWCHS
jgi:hypothetical protein